MWSRYGGIKYGFLATGILSGLCFAHGVRAAAASKPGTIQWDGSLPTTGYWQRPLRGILAVVGVAALYFGLKSLVSKSWHIVAVLLLRYYLRGVALTGIGLTLFPMAFVRCGLFGRRDGSKAIDGVQSDQTEAAAGAAGGAADEEDPMLPAAEGAGVSEG